MMSVKKESLGISRIAALHVFVRDLERSRDHYTHRLDFSEVGASTPFFESEHRARASVVEAGGARLVFMEPLGSKGESFRWLEKHPEGGGRIVFQVEDAERALAILRERRATLVTPLETPPGQKRTASTSGVTLTQTRMMSQAAASSPAVAWAVAPASTNRCVRPGVRL